MPTEYKKTNEKRSERIIELLIKHGFGRMDFDSGVNAIDKILSRRKQSKQTKACKMWAFLNYNVIWGVSHTRKQVRKDLATYVGYTDKQIAEKLKDKSIVIKPCVVTYD